jgi:predicted class III extradiol MEMO1 family dioxygenase
LPFLQPSLKWTFRIFAISLKPLNTEGAQNAAEIINRFLPGKS